ncbi:MAG: site-specific DNA-methyltransferase, partial [Paludibacteraceae bacterium]|nr:site-specific DNA-methyltransferase [Paludibacteraceae bacterium]
MEKIAQLFPSCVTEAVSEDGSIRHLIDFEALKRQLSGATIPEGKERYVFSWPGKSEAQRLANTSSTSTLRPCRDKSIDFDSTKNIYIDGDNFEALKLLRETYLGKIKMIYIDPPYNTGNDFVYNDRFSMSKKDYVCMDGNYDDQGNCLVLNTIANGRFHTDWLNMIYPRVLLSKDFLEEDGTVFISINDYEITNLLKICEEIFGKDNVEAYKDLKLVRRIKKGSTVVANLDDTSVEAYANNKVNEAVNYTFEDAGTYTIIYTANNGTNTTPESQKSFTVIVEEGFLDTVVPTVTVTDFVFDDDNNVLYSVKPNQKILVAYPSVIDYVDPTDASNTNVADKSPTLKTFMCLTSVYANVTTAVQGFMAADPTLTLVEAIEKVLNESNIASLSELELNEDGDYFEGTV